MRTKERREELNPVSGPRRSMDARSRPARAVRLRLRRDVSSPSSLSEHQLQMMREAAERVSQQMIAWARQGESAVSKVLEGESAEEWKQYPSQSQQAPAGFKPFFYHCHPPAQTPRDEHGHFHVFVQEDVDRGTPRYSHLIAVAVDGRGLPKRLFTTNRWVTGEQWIAAGRLRHLCAESWGRTGQGDDEDPLMQWLRSILQLFLPQIDALLKRRQERVAMWTEKELEDRRRHVISDCRIDIMKQIKHVAHL